MPHNLRSKEDATGRAGNFERRLRETMDTESDPEQITPNTAGAEELPYEENFPLVKQFNQTNMRPGGRRKGGGQSQRGKDDQD
jgi:hypothetical protein